MKFKNLKSHISSNGDCFKNDEQELTSHTEIIYLKSHGFIEEVSGETEKPKKPRRPRKSDTVSGTTGAVDDELFDDSDAETETETEAETETE